MNRENFLLEVKNLGIELSDYQLLQFEEYYNLLVTENMKYNLTNITENEMVYLKHFYDSLTLYKVIKISDEKFCDIGSGAGFPGIALKIAFPNLKLTLIESNGKKCNFLRLVCDKLNLSNVTIINERAEIYSINNREKFDVVTSRAVAPLKHLLEYSIPMVKVNGYFVPMKSNVNNELDNIDNYYRKLNLSLENKIVFDLPDNQGLRTLLLYKKMKPTDKRYPRKYTEIKKKDI